MMSLFNHKILPVTGVSCSNILSNFANIENDRLVGFCNWPVALAAV